MSSIAHNGKQVSYVQSEHPWNDADAISEENLTLIDCMAQPVRSEGPRAQLHAAGRLISKLRRDQDALFRVALAYDIALNPDTPERMASQILSEVRNVINVHVSHRF